MSEAKNKLSALLDQVRAGASILIVDRGRPVARLEPAVNSDDDEGRLMRLERAGILRRGKNPPPLELIKKKPPGKKLTRSIVDVVIEERRSGW